jgi:hypothetical protein
MFVEELERVGGCVIGREEECDVCVREIGRRGIRLVMDGEGNGDKLLIEREGIEGELMVKGGSAGGELEIERGGE